jgi:cysteine-rich repeat protein
VEGGWSCTGAPSVCTPNCGNGALDAGEACDDNGTAAGDGCSALCAVESGYTCSGAPSVCARTCGNGLVVPAQGEACDDGNAAGGDGCSSACTVEPGYTCAGQPSLCTFVCGNGTFQSGETCDDGDAAGGDGCSAVCQIETGWLCAGMPSVCTPVCGDGLIRGAEACDDGAPAGGDGCSFGCQPEVGYQCTGEPSNCVPVCGDGFIRGGETCDDGDTDDGDGCSGDLCFQEVGYTCMGQPSVCTRNCGDGNLDAFETCDDGNTAPGDGCSAICRSEPGYACGGEPSACGLTCGNQVLNSGETCDDGNAAGGDGCSANCRNESGWLCPSPGLPCAPFEVVIDAPAHGVFSTAGAVGITGHYTVLPPGQVAVTVNGVPADSVNELTRTFSHTLPLDAETIFNPVRVSLTNTANGDDVRDRIVVIAGGSVADGAHALQSVAVRVNDSGLDVLEPLVTELAGDQLDLATLLPAGTTLADQCFIPFIGCWGGARVRIANPPPSFGTLGLAADAQTDLLATEIDITDLRVDIDIDGYGLVPDCGLRLTASALQLTGDYALEPEPADPSYVGVNVVGDVGAGFSGFNHSFTYGLCTWPIIGDIIQSLLPDIEQFAVDGLSGFLADPDGGGPEDSALAQVIEDTLAGISISGAVGSGIGLGLDAPLFQVTEDPDGITLGADAAFTVSVGTGPGQCVPPPGAPDLTASYAPPEAFPPFGPLTPVGGDPYGLAIGISTAAFNQLLRGQTECGLMRTSLAEIDLDGAGGAPPQAITSTFLSLLVPEFSLLPAGTPMRIDIAPTLAPIVNGDLGPDGSLAELAMAHVRVDVVEAGPETLWLSGAFDIRLGMDLAFLPDGSGLAVTIGQPSAADVSLTVLRNPLGTDEALVEAVLPAVMLPLIPELAGAFSGFPLPQFFGLNLEGAEVSRNGDFLALFANLVPAP